MILSVKNIKLVDMNKDQREDLADFVRRIRLEKGLTLKQVEQKSGGEITSGYVSQIENRHVINPTIDKLTALAKGLGISKEELSDKAFKSSSPESVNEYKQSLYFLLWEKRQQTTDPEKRRFIDKLIEVGLKEVG